jgi:segregation and condensation protein A
MMEYVVKVEAYEGPFDLLLDLIEQNEIDILDIPIAVVTQQYLEYLYSMQEQDLAIGGEFLVMAATLLRIKAKMLLPPDEAEQEEPEEEDADPREQLVEQLLRYKAFKEVAALLTERYQGTTGFFTRGVPIHKTAKAPIFTNLVGDLTVDDLALQYRQLLEDLSAEPPYHTVVQRISVAERLADIRVQLVGRSRIGFDELLSRSSRQEVVVTFLAVLELVRLREIRVRQSSIFGYIEIVPQHDLGRLSYDPAGSRANN